MNAPSGSEREGLADRAFRFGFLALEVPPRRGVVPQTWRHIAAPDLGIWVHPEAPSRLLVGPDWRVVVIGDIYVAHGAGSVERLLTDLATKEDHAVLDQLGGRHVLIVGGRGGWRVYNDAFGSRAVYYRRGEVAAFASHATLLAEAHDDALDPAAVAFRDSTEYTQRGTSYLPGDRTMYPSIFALVPNNYLDVARGRTVRYWPTSALVESVPEAFASLCDEYFARTAEYLIPRFRPLLGVTGGTDGRALIAGLRHFGLDGAYFTWEARLQEGERDLVEAMVDHLGVAHAFVDVSRRTAASRDEGMRMATRMATGFSRGASALTANMGSMAPARGVFLRGYGGEILRGFYNRHNRVLKEISPATLSELYFTRRVARPGRRARSFAEEAFAGFMQRAHYGSGFFGRDSLDMFYWEHRMGTWGALMLGEMDPVLYSMVGFNSRRLFECAFGLPSDYRLGTQLLIDLTARYDSGLARIGAAS